MVAWFSLLIKIRCLGLYFDYRSVTVMIEVIETQSQAYYLLKQKQIYWMVKEKSSCNG